MRMLVREQKAEYTFCSLNTSLLLIQSERARCMKFKMNLSQLPLLYLKRSHSHSKIKMIQSRYILGIRVCLLFFLGVIGCTPLDSNYIEAESQLKWEEGETSAQIIFTWSDDALSVHNENPLLTFYFTSPENQSLSPQDHQWTLVIENQNPDQNIDESQDLKWSQTDFTARLTSEVRVDEVGTQLGDGLLGYLTLPLCQSVVSSSSRGVPQACLPCPSITQTKCVEEGLCQCEMKWTLVRKNGPFPPLNTRLSMSLTQRTPTDALFSFSP